MLDVNRSKITNVTNAATDSFTPPVTSYAQARGASRLSRRPLCLSLAGAALCSAMVAPQAFSQVVYLAPPPVYAVAPPVMQPVVPVPSRRWVPGHWQWQNNNYIWQEGVWEDLRPAGSPYLQSPQSQEPQVERLSTDTLFNFDQGNANDITAEGRADIAQIAERLRSGHFSHVDIRGYTDRLGSDSYNVALSQRRAQTVKQLLVQAGIPAEKIRAEGLGKQNPIATCDNVSGAEAIHCLQPNRRVEIVTYVSDDDGSAEGAEGPDYGPSNGAPSAPGAAAPSAPPAGAAYYPPAYPATYPPTYAPTSTAPTYGAPANMTPDDDY